MQVKLFVIFLFVRVGFLNHKICEKTPQADTRASLPGAFFVTFCLLTVPIWRLRRGMRCGSRG